MAARFVRQIHGFEGSDGSGSSWSNEGTETRAEVLLRIVRERVLLVMVNLGM